MEVQVRKIKFLKRAELLIIILKIITNNKKLKIDHNNFLIDNSLKGALMAYYYIRKGEAKIEGDKFMINHDINICKKIWGLTETKESKKIIKLALPSIEFRQSFYLLRNEYDKINEEENIDNNPNFMFCKLHQKLYFIYEYEEHLKTHKKLPNV